MLFLKRTLISEDNLTIVPLEKCRSFNTHLNREIDFGNARCDNSSPENVVAARPEVFCQDLVNL